jgi:serine/threonine-protein kinase
VQAPNPGEILLGKYRVEAIIGVGGMGRVVKASHMYLQQPVAIKILLPESASSESTVARFLREAQSTVRLRSEHIARVMDVGTLPDGAPFMVMEFLEGHDLNQILRHHGPQQPQAVVDLLLQACEGMAEAHAMGIIHRDIKPSNFFITRRPDGSNLLKILDFGISKTPAELSEITGQQTVIGTPTYMAPEQMASARQTDPRSDIWSIGVVMYQLLAGRPPFEAETYPQLVLKVSSAPPAPLHVALPPGLQDIVFRCLEKDPSRRIQSVGELARMLAPYASDPISAQHVADRAARILMARGANPGPQIPGSASGLPMTPPTLTPKSWNKSDGSLPGGQLGTRVLRTSSGFVIGGVAALCIVAGIGGFFVASSVKKSGKHDTTVEMPATKQMKATVEPSEMPPVLMTAGEDATKPPSGSGDPTPPAKPSTPKLDAVKSDTAKGDAAKDDAAKADAAKADAAKADATKADATKADAAKADDAKADDAKADTAKTPRATTASTKAKPAKSTRSTKPTKPEKSDKTDDDLFDDRK